MNRRSFLSLAAGTAAVSALTSAAPVARAATTDDAPKSAPAAKRFTMHFAPHFGMFQHSAGKDLVDQLKFAADQGYSGWEDNEMKNRSSGDQERIAKAMTQLDMRMGVISALRGTWNNITFAGGDADARDLVLKQMRDIVDIAKRTNTTLLCVVPGWTNPKLTHEEETASCIELLKRCCDIVEPHNLVMVIEPINKQKGQSKIFMFSVVHAFEICQAVNRPSCKILCDIFHQQMGVGYLMPNIDHCWKEIAYFQCGDAPTGKEPGTGEINYVNVIRHIKDKGYTGVIGMEHGNSKPGKEGERAVIEAYRRIDPA
jgi:hydroxypyruvate isomerase